jgi:hypothetical protein
MANLFTRKQGTLPKRSNLSGPSQQQYHALSRIGTAHIREHRKTVSAWENETPTFVKNIVTTGNITELTVSLSGDPLGVQKYLWTDLGTEPHDINPTKPGGRLVFDTPYYPSTEPRIIASKKASRGSTRVVAEGVHHPGVEPRRFTETINNNLAEHDLRLVSEAGLGL